MSDSSSSAVSTNPQELDIQDAFGELHKRCENNKSSADTTYKENSKENGYFKKINSKENRKKLDEHMRDQQERLIQMTICWNSFKLAFERQVQKKPSAAELASRMAIKGHLDNLEEESTSASQALTNILNFLQQYDQLPDDDQEDLHQFFIDRTKEQYDVYRNQLDLMMKEVDGMSEQVELFVNDK